ncbi:MAG: hypothetical protein ABI585_10150 [Betaproteobacteria bacterium]
MTPGGDLAERRARLVALSDLERLKLGLAWRDVRRAIAPAPDVGRRSRVRPYVVRAVGYALPLIGFHRMGRLLRTAGAGLAIWRATRAWRSLG